MTTNVFDNRDFPWNFPYKFFMKFSWQILKFSWQMVKKNFSIPRPACGASTPVKILKMYRLTWSDWLCQQIRSSSESMIQISIPKSGKLQQDGSGPQEIPSKDGLRILFQYLARNRLHSCALKYSVCVYCNNLPGRSNKMQEWKCDHIDLWRHSYILYIIKLD